MVRASNVRRFVHLRVHSTYSLGVGLSSAADVCAHAQRAGYDAVALTDINGTYGFVEFHHAAKSIGIKPIYGTLVVVDSIVDDAAPPDERHALILLALDRGGLRNVCEAASISASRREGGESFEVADLDGLGDGVVCIVGLPSTVTAVLPRTSRAVLASLQSQFADRLFIEHLVHVPAAQRESRHQLEALAASTGVAPVMCQDVRFVGPEKHQLIDLIGSGDAPERDAPGDGSTHGMLSPDEMSVHYERNAEAYTNASLIASLVQPDILDALGTSDRTIKSLPAIDRGDDVHGVFTERVRAAFEREFEGIAAEERKEWEVRLKEEMDIIHGTELEDTFLQFQEIVQRTRRDGGAPGPATGLRLQSLCAYLLGITCFNPYVVDERFHPFFDERDRANRVLDLQIPAGRRAVTIAGLHALFDEAGVGYVPSVEHITAGRALKMIAKRMESQPPEYEEIVRIAARSPGATLQDLCTQNGRVGWLYKKSAVIREIVSHAAAIEGLPFGFIRSRRTLIISPNPICDFLGSTTNPESGERFVQSTRDSFPIGSITRVDLTALNALAVCARLGATGERDAPLPWEEAMRHGDIYRRIRRGEVDGVYLLETELIQRLAKEFEVGSFDDLLCFLALMRYRRGGLSLADRVKSYREEPRDLSKAPDEIRYVLNETNGWILFHDQLRDIVSVVTGLDPLNSAQMARRFARQNPAELATLRREFMMFAVERGTPMEVANSSFTWVLRAAGSTVSRQQIIAEALIVSTMLYLKKRKEVAYFTSLLNVHRRNEGKRAVYLEWLTREGRLLRPHINRSGNEYIEEDTGVRPPFWSIEGISEETSACIVATRGANKIRNRQEFDCLIADADVTYKAVEALVGAGALESVGIPANEKVRPPVEDPARGHAPDQLAFELDSPGSTSGTQAPPEAPSLLTSDPTDGNKRGSFHVLPTLAEFYPHPIASRVELAGRISELRSFRSSSGETVGFFTLRDSTASVPVYVPWERVDQYGEPLADRDSVLVRGTVKIREGRKVCEATEVAVRGGGIKHGETTPDQSAEGDS